MLTRIFSILFCAALALAPTGCTQVVEDNGDDMGEAWGKSGDLFTQRNDVVVGLQAQFDEPGYHTIQLGVPELPVDPVHPTLSGIFASEANITWTNNGVPVNRRVSVGNGATISGCGEAVSVSVRDKTPNLGGFNTPNQQYTVSINVTSGLRPNYPNQPPILLTSSEVVATSAGTAVFGGTSGVSQLGAAGTSTDNITIPVPQDAGAISMYLTVETAGGNIAPQLIVVQQAGTNSPSFPVNAFNLQATPQFIPLVPNTTAVFLRNLDASNAVNFQLVWGIEG